MFATRLVIKGPIDNLDLTATLRRHLADRDYSWEFLPGSIIRLRSKPEISITIQTPLDPFTPFTSWANESAGKFPPFEPGTLLYWSTKEEAGAIT